MFIVKFSMYNFGLSGLISKEVMLKSKYVLSKRRVYRNLISSSFNLSLIERKFHLIDLCLKFKSIIYGGESGSDLIE